MIFPGKKEEERKGGRTREREERGKKRGRREERSEEEGEEGRKEDKGKGAVSQQRGVSCVDEGGGKERGGGGGVSYHRAIACIPLLQLMLEVTCLLEGAALSYFSSSENSA